MGYDWYHEGRRLENTARFIRSARLERAGFRHAFTLVGLDFGPRAAAEARAAACREAAGAIGVAPERLYQVQQVHGARVVEGRGERDAVLREEADALVARDPSSAVGVRVADCVAVLVGDLESGAVAAIHAGWRGVVAGAVRGGLAALGGRARVAAVFPHIGPCCFEVDAEVARQVVAACGDASAVAAWRGDKAHVDLGRAVLAQLRAEGLDGADVEAVAGCTRCDADRFYSHRRAPETSGRHLAAIAVR